MKHYSKIAYHLSPERIIHHFKNKCLLRASKTSAIVNTSTDCFFVSNTVEQIESVIEEYKKEN